MAGFRLDLDVSAGLSRAPEILDHARELLDLAAARALRKTAAWLRTHSSREISRELRITQTPLRHRFTIYSQARQGSVKLWVGLNPLSVHYLGDPKQTPTGVKVGHRHYDDAFISPMKSSARMVWRRKGRARLPIERVEEDWEGEGLTALERWERRAIQRFAELFEQEARHALEAAQ